MANVIIEEEKHVVLTPRREPVGGRIAFGAFLGFVAAVLSFSGHGILGWVFALAALGTLMGVFPRSHVRRRLEQPVRF